MWHSDHFFSKCYLFCLILNSSKLRQHRSRTHCLLGVPEKVGLGRGRRGGRAVTVTLALTLPLGGRQPGRLGCFFHRVLTTVSKLNFINAYFLAISQLENGRKPQFWGQFSTSMTLTTHFVSEDAFALKFVLYPRVKLTRLHKRKLSLMEKN